MKLVRTINRIRTGSNTESQFQKQHQTQENVVVATTEIQVYNELVVFVVDSFKNSITHAACGPTCHRVLAPKTKHKHPAKVTVVVANPEQTCCCRLYLKVLRDELLLTELINRMAHEKEP